MRINVYAEEITDRVELVRKTPYNVPGVTFYGARFYLASPPQLHQSAADDDSPAITLWVPWTKAHGHDWSIVLAVLEGLRAAIHEAIVEVDG